MRVKAHQREVLVHIGVGKHAWQIAERMGWSDYRATQSLMALRRKRLVRDDPSGIWYRTFAGDAIVEAGE